MQNIGGYPFAPHTCFETSSGKSGCNSCRISPFPSHPVSIAFGQSYKPGSVLDDHLSRLAIADKLQRPTYREVTGSHPWSLFGLAPDGVYTAGMSPYRR